MTSPISTVPQITLFLDPAGHIHAECAAGPVRRKIDLPEGHEFAAIYEELLTQRDRIAAETRRKTDKFIAESKALHNRVWAVTALRHTIAFACQHIGPPPKSSPKVSNSTNKSLEDLGL